MPDAENFSRAVEFSIDEQNMQVSQVWEYRGPQDTQWFTPTRGDADLLQQTGNVLVTFGDIAYENGTEIRDRFSRVLEVNRDGETVFDLEISSPGFDSLVYRSERIQLYPPEFEVTYLPGEGDCNADGLKLADDLACVTTIAGRDFVLAAIHSAPGDLDGDGQVAFDDFLVVASHFGQQGIGYSQGDVSLDGQVGFADFLQIASNFQDASVANVPEPGIRGLVLGGDWPRNPFSTTDVRVGLRPVGRAIPIARPRS